MQKQTIKIEVDTTSVDEALAKVRELTQALRALGLPYTTGNTLDLAEEIHRQEKRGDGVRYI